MTQLSFIGQTDLDWPEDWANGEDNGCYVHQCDSCEKRFFGHKRRSTCKKCQSILDGFANEAKEYLDGFTMLDSIHANPMMYKSAFIDGYVYRAAKNFNFKE